MIIPVSVGACVTTLPLRELNVVDHFVYPEQCMDRTADFTEINERVGYTVRLYQTSYVPHVLKNSTCKQLN